MVKQILGKQNPVDFMSRHLVLIEGLSLEEREGHTVDKGEDVTIMTVICNNLPLVMT